MAKSLNLGRVTDLIKSFERVSGDGSSGSIDVYRFITESGFTKDIPIRNGRNGTTEGLTIDSELKENSTNPIENQAVAKAISKNATDINKLGGGIYGQAFKRNVLFDTKTIDKPFEESTLEPYTNDGGKLTFTNNLGSASFVNLYSTVNLDYFPSIDIIFHFGISYVETTTCKLILQIFNTDGTFRFFDIESNLRVGESELSVNCNSVAGKDFDHATVLLQLTGAITIDYLDIYQFSGDTGNVPIQSYLEKLTKYEQGQNLFLYDSANSIPNHYYGTEGQLQYSSIEQFHAMAQYIPIIGGHKYSACNFRKDLHAVQYFLNAGWVFYDSEKRFISFYDGALNNYAVPANASFMRFSIAVDNYHLRDPQFVILIKEGTISGIDEYSPVIQNEVDYSRISKPITTRLTVGKDSSGNYDFTSIRTALESITDSSETHLYEVLVNEGVYELADDYSADEMNASGWEGLKMPNFTKLIGVGNRKNIIIRLTLDTPKELPSTLNLKENCELENITFDSTNARYTIHDDSAVDLTVSHKKRFRNCVFKCTKSYYSVCYGVGMHAGSDWEFDNCSFELTNEAGGMAMYMHNKQDYQQLPLAGDVTFRNCRFLVNGQPSSYQLNTLSGSVPLTCFAHFYGCRLGDLKLIANEGSAGCYWFADGYGNTMGNVTITSNDSNDYSDQVNFI